MDIVGVVVLYHPDIRIYENIKSYVSELKKLYILDNSEYTDDNIVTMISSFRNVEYVSFKENKGLSYALNVGLRKAKGYSYLLTMDQDSCFLPGDFRKYKNKITQLATQEKYSSIAIFSVMYTGIKNEKKIKDDSFVESAITSGSVLRMSLAKKIGEFDPKLFIDEVDNEYCYRALASGYKIWRFSDIKLKHELGIPNYQCILGWDFVVLNHSAIRKYYIVRNRLYVAQKFPAVKGKYIKKIVSMFIKVLLFENDKISKIKHMVKGIRDFKAKRYGKYKSG